MRSDLSVGGSLHVRTPFELTNLGKIDGGLLQVSTGTMDLNNLSGTLGTLEVLGGHMTIWQRRHMYSINAAGTYQRGRLDPDALGGSWSNAGIDQREQRDR